MPAIEYENVSKSYDDRVIVNNFSLSVEKGEFLTIIGTSGSGKTTLLKMVNGLISPDSGTVRVAGKDISKDDLIHLRRITGYAIQGSILFPHMTVKDNIAYVPNLLNGKNKAKTAAAVNKWMDIVGLEDDLLRRYPDELSGGQQQRVGIARALAASPEILLMDEPFGAIDGITRRQLQSELLRIHKQTGITIMFVTHDIREALKLGSRVLVMDKGEIEQCAPPSEVSTYPASDFVKNLVLE